MRQPAKVRVPWYVGFILETLLFSPFFAFFARRFSSSGLRKLRKRLGCSFHKVSAFLFKADHQKQEAFIQDYEQDKGKVEAEGWRRSCVDGVHPLYGLEVVFSCWLLAGQRFEAGVGGGRKRLNIFGAYGPDDREYWDRRDTDKNRNAPSVIELFTVMRARHPNTKHFGIYLDNAKYQHAKLVQEWVEQTKKESAVTFDLKYVPAYSPHLKQLRYLRAYLVLIPHSGPSQDGPFSFFR